MDTYAEKEKYYREIAIAQKFLRESKIDCLCKGKSMVCDIYCAVSLEHQTFCVQVYEDGEDFLLVYAKTYVKGFGDEFTTLSFSDCVRFSEHAAVIGKIVCGVKAVPRSDCFFCNLMECLPVSNRWSQTSGILIDGVLTVVRSYYRGRLCATVGFRCEEELDAEMFSAEQRHFLKKLYITVAEIIRE